MQVRSEKILTQTDLKGALVGASGDFSLSKLSALVNSRSRNRLVLAAYIDHCTEPAPEGSRAQTAELDEKHRALAAYRGRFVAEAMQGRTRRYESKQSGRESSAEDGSYDEEGDEDEEEAREIYAVPSATTAQELTGGLSMAGRRAVRKTIAFAVDIKHAEAMNAVFGAAGVWQRAAGGQDHRQAPRHCDGLPCGSLRRSRESSRTISGPGGLQLRGQTPGWLCLALLGQTQGQHYMSRLLHGVCRCRCLLLCHPQPDAS